MASSQFNGTSYINMYARPRTTVAHMLLYSASIRPYIMKLNNTFLNNQVVSKEIKKEFRKYFEKHEIENNTKHIGCN